MSEQDPKDYRIIITGNVAVSQNLEEVLSFDREVVGFNLPDGRTVRPIIALEIESKDGKDYDFISSEEKMRELGIELTDYDETKFEEEEQK